MSQLKTLALFLGIAVIPVITLAKTAAGFVWTASLSMSDAILMTLVIGVPFAAFAWLLTWRLPHRRTMILAIVGWFALAFVHIGSLRARMYEAGWNRAWHWWLIMVLLGGVAYWIGSRFDTEARYLTTFVPILVGLQLILLISDLARTNEPPPAAVTSSQADIGEPPSIWFVVLDSNASPKVLRDIHGIDLADIIERYEVEGFRVWDDARANYSQTLVSIPSLLTGTVWDAAEVEASYAEMLAGVHADTPLLAALSQAGATIRMVPTNWSRSGCGALVDRCYDAPRYDDHWYFLFRSTPLPDLFPRRFAHPWPTGGVETLRQMGEVAMSDPTSSHFTFVHSLASHPPAIVDAGCAAVRPSDGDLGEQLRCTHTTLLDAIDHIDLGTDIVVVTADHGYEVGSISTPPESWSDATARDRMSAFTAISTPRGCEDTMSDELSGAQILPLLLNCYGADIDVPEHRFMKVNHQSYGGATATELAWDGWSPYAPQAEAD